LETSWPAQARPNQLPPPGDWNVWLLLAGRGFGKTRTLAEWANDQAVSGQASRIAIVAATAADARDVLV
jgi:phage terminase large subunit-like protein